MSDVWCARIIGLMLGAFIVITFIGGFIWLHNATKQDLKSERYYFDACMKEANESSLVKGNEIVAHYNCMGIAIEACNINGCLLENAK